MTSPVTPTSDLVDEYGSSLSVCDLQLHQYGGRTAFRGVATTLVVHEDDAQVREILGEPGTGRVLVVDGGGSLHTALMGDLMAGRGVENGWEGVIIHGAVRDVAALRGLDIGIKALGANPRRSAKEGTGRRDVSISLGGAPIAPGDEVVSDDDGVVVLPRA